MSIAQNFLQQLSRLYPHQPEYLQAVEEWLGSVAPVLPRFDQLEQQALLRTSGDERSYLWFTSWSGEAKRLKGRPFEGARVVGGADTRPVLAKLGQFGRRRFSGLWQVIHTDEGRES